MRIQIDMVEPIVHRVPRDPRLRTEEPSFLRVVWASAVVLAIFFLIAYFVLRDSGRALLPGVQQTSHPHAMLAHANPHRIRA